MSQTPKDKTVTEYLRRLGNPYAKLSMFDDCAIEPAEEPADVELFGNPAKAVPMPATEMEKGLLRRQLENIQARIAELRDRIAGAK